MTSKTTFIGFGEAAKAFAADAAFTPVRHAFDLKTLNPITRDPKHADYNEAKVAGATSLQAALDGADFVLSLVTADQALSAATSATPLLAKGAYFFDMNSVAPQTKQASGAMIEASGAHYVDVAIMAPVHPALTSVSLLVSGPAAHEGAAALVALGFSNVRIVGDKVGAAASIKMLRSILIKGIEALSAEVSLAAFDGGVLEEVVMALGGDWATRLDYNLDRMMVHGGRRSEEMSEVVRTLAHLGHDGIMSQSTATTHAAIGVLGLKDPPQGLTQKLLAIKGALQLELAHAS